MPIPEPPFAQIWARLAEGLLHKDEVIRCVTAVQFMHTDSFNMRLRLRNNR
ncbi:hypothetical protein SAMN05216567_1032 [Variovorax sp. OK605]|nr:hypothetical protein SAMN05216567_1032 [Variovorax sp. OK605]